MPMGANRTKRTFGRRAHSAVSFCPPDPSNITAALRERALHVCRVRMSVVRAQGPFSVAPVLNLIVRIRTQRISVPLLLRRRCATVALSMFADHLGIARSLEGQVGFCRYRFCATGELKYRGAVGLGYRSTVPIVKIIRFYCFKLNYMGLLTNFC